MWSWADEFEELYASLSPEEYRAAMESTLAAFYTPPVVIKGMYEALECLGFSEGSILEIILPSLIQGIGKIKKCALAVQKPLLGCKRCRGYPVVFILYIKR